MALNSSIKLVCFDLGGVMVRICRTWTEACEAAGIEDRTCQCARDQMLRAWRILGNELQLGRIAGDTFAERFSQAVGGLYSPAEVAAINGAWVLGEYEGMLELVRQLHAEGFETAALSNTCQEHWVELVRMPAISALQRRFASHELELMKPDEAIYRAFEEQTGFAGPQIAFFDDLKENVAGARRLGWFASQVDPLGSPAAQIRQALQSTDATVTQ